MRRHDGRTLELVILLDRREPALEESVCAEDLALFVTPAINLFEKACEPILLDRRRRDFHIVPDRVRPLDFEVHSLREVTADGGDGGTQRIRQLYRLDAGTRAQAPSTLERRPRLFSARDLARGAARSTYLGSEVFLCLAGGRAAAGDLKRLFVKANCSNRDLPLFLLRIRPKASSRPRPGRRSRRSRSQASRARPNPRSRTASLPAPARGRATARSPGGS